MNVSGANRPSITTAGAVAAPVTINYNPVSYAAPTDYRPKFILVNSALTQRMLVFPEAVKTFDGTTAVTLLTLKGNPAGVSLIADPGSSANFNTFDPGTNKSVTFSGYRLVGPNADQYALARSCCGPIVNKTTGTINPSSTSTAPYGFLMGLAGPAFNSFYSAGLMPQVVSDAGNNFFTFTQEEEEVVAPRVIPFNPPAVPYVAPLYTPKPARN